MADDYRVLNRANWDERAAMHVAAPEYRVSRFLTEPDFLSDVVRFDLPLLGDVRGLRGVHLQCHIGTDTISLARLGANMTGLDFSAASLAQARKLAEQAGAEVDFVEADVYEAVSALGAERFDLVFTGIGALCWLPSVERWAKTVAGLLRPAGRLFLREGHPMLWAIDETVTDRSTLGYPYFETSEPMVFAEDTTYVETDGRLEQTTTHEWNHGLGEVVSALLANGMTITGLTEHRSVPWNALPGRMTCDEHGEWRMIEHPERLPLSYTLRARKN
ncbi:class I SAM-dependent methyltransferase [Nocardia amikacinitolerans]|uniref:class I SAM-dependent methyltransferase n=1 Tax=Nocardia amikacinitolerans TaxID=756689 RepID=UPI0020A251F6|nr:class I SAM-dependent methyltransferase [Nocardia amikacinitolerans]MCP2287650.1 Methyltransferase domain-containing protein [Nocardia amikacinitolerans]